MAGGRNHNAYRHLVAGDRDRENLIPFRFQNNNGRRRGAGSMDGCCPDIISLLIGLYHFAYSGGMAYKKSREWWEGGKEIRRLNLPYSNQDYIQDFILPFAYTVSRHLMYSALGLILLCAIFHRSVLGVERCLIWVGVLDLVVFLQSGAYVKGLFTIGWEVVTSVLQLGVLWSLVAELKKEAETEERRDNVRQAIVDQQEQRPPQRMLREEPHPIPLLPPLAQPNRNRVRRLDFPTLFNFEQDSGGGRSVFPYVTRDRTGRATQIRLEQRPERGQRIMSRGFIDLTNEPPRRTTQGPHVHVSSRTSR